MNIHIVHYNDSRGDVVDIAYQCSRFCMIDELIKGAGVGSFSDSGHDDSLSYGSVDYGAHPCGDETDYDVYCSACGDFLWHGLNCECPEEDGVKIDPPSVEVEW